MAETSKWTGYTLCQIGDIEKTQKVSERPQRIGKDKINMVGLLGPVQATKNNS